MPEQSDKHLLDLLLPQEIIPRLCDRFYSLGWVSGTGGGVSVRHFNNVYVAPSGVQKELVRPEDIFTLRLNGDIIFRPPKNLKVSECTPLFLVAYQKRDAGSVIHSHHLSASLITQIIKGNEFRISHQEMIKGIKKGKSDVSYRYDETLVIPIIENTPFEKNLTDSLAKAIEDYPDSNAVLVRRHGVYIWGANWIQAKTMAECFHYLFETAIKLHQFGLPLVVTP